MIAADVATPLGPALLIADDSGRLRAFGWCDDADARARLLARHPNAAPGEPPAAIVAALDRYWRGELSALAVVSVAPAGSAFQLKVWEALRVIPPGITRSYLDLARAVGGPTFTRAVGLANGANPVGLFIPCHRVVGADGSLTGYAAGVARKRWLLAHEGVAAFTQGALFD